MFAEVHELIGYDAFLQHVFRYAYDDLFARVAWACFLCFAVVGERVDAYAVADVFFLDRDGAPLVVRAVSCVDKNGFTFVAVENVDACDAVVYRDFHCPGSFTVFTVTKIPGQFGHSPGSDFASPHFGHTKIGVAEAVGAGTCSGFERLPYKMQTAPLL